MSTSGDDEYEHWPAAKSKYYEPAVPAPGYDNNNGRHSHSYLVPKEPSPAASRADSKSPQPAPLISYPQPIYYAQSPYDGGVQAYPPGPVAHPNAQYYSHPVPVYQMPQGFYPATPQVPIAPSAPVAPQGSHGHYYVPAAAQEAEPKPKANAWLGRTKAQVEEDNMKIAKAEGAWGERKIAPTGINEDQMCWVVEIDGSHTLRAFRDIKDMTGEWKEDPRYKKSYYFVREEEKKKA